MGIKYIDWYNRIASRSDITGRVTHLTRPQGIDTSSMTFEEINIAAVDNLIKILTDKQINGSTTETGYIIGNKKRETTLLRCRLILCQTYYISQLWG